jgi:hypothetical protein
MTWFDTSLAENMMNFPSLRGFQIASGLVEFNVPSNASFCSVPQGAGIHHLFAKEGLWEERLRRMQQGF